MFLHVLKKKKLYSSKVNNGECVLPLTMKVYKGSGSAAPYILNLDKDKVSPSRLNLFTSEKESRYPFNRRLGGNVCLCGYFFLAKIRCVDCPSTAQYVLEFCASK
jgi:hypothetical protein